MNVVPNRYIDIPVTTSPVLHDLNKLGTLPNLTSLAGRRVRFRATAAVTIMSGDQTGAPALTAGAGVVLAQDVLSERFFVPPGATIPLTVIAAGAATLRVFFYDG